MPDSLSNKKDSSQLFKVETTKKGKSSLTMPVEPGMEGSKEGGRME